MGDDHDIPDFSSELSISTVLLSLPPLLAEHGVSCREGKRQKPNIGLVLPAVVQKRPPRWGGQLWPRITTLEQKNLHCCGFSDILGHAVLGRYRGCSVVIQLFEIRRP